MTQIGWQPDEVQLSMNEIYERRARENEELARQRKEAIDQVNASYQNLKKKVEPVQLDSFVGTFPGEPTLEQDVTLDALNEIDSSVMNHASRRGSSERYKHSGCISYAANPAAQRSEVHDRKRSVYS